MIKLYQSEKWLRYQYQVLKRTPEEIAKECNVTLMTIYRQLTKFGLMRK